MELLKNRRLILASKSPRRSQLLAEAGFDFEIKTKEIEESYPADMLAIEVASFLAKKKAAAFADDMKDGEIVLTSDTIVVLGNTIFGKPKDYDDAFQILRQLSGTTHLVITGVCLLSTEKEKVFQGVAKVYFKDLSDEEIDFYIRKFEPYDKAGAYAIQEWIGLCKIEKIEGTYSTIMGLPVEMVYEELRKF